MGTCTKTHFHRILHSDRHTAYGGRLIWPNVILAYQQNKIIALCLLVLSFGLGFLVFFFVPVSFGSHSPVDYCLQTILAFVFFICRYCHCRRGRRRCRCCCYGSRKEKNIIQLTEITVRSIRFSDHSRHYFQSKHGIVSVSFVPSIRFVRLVFN